MQGARKKLKEAAALLARGQLRIPQSPDDSDAPETQATKALAAVGLYPETPVRLEDEFALWPDCVDAFRHYCALQTQWTENTMGRRIGLNYAGVNAYMAMCGMEKEQCIELLHDVQIMEFAALDAQHAAR